MDFMKLIKQSYEILESKGSLKDIELAGRVCYKSEDKISEDNSSAIAFVNNLIERKHYAMLEFGENIILSISERDMLEYFRKLSFLSAFKAINISYIPEYYIISFNPRTALEILEYIESIDYNISITSLYNTLLDCLPKEFIKDKTKREIPYKLSEDFVVCSYDDLKDKIYNHHKTVTVKFITNRGISHEIVRHRICSFAQESTRYCNYSKDKFKKSISYIAPNWLNINENIGIDIYKNKNYNVFKALYMSDQDKFKMTCLDNELEYFVALKSGETAQQARGKLSHDLKTEIIVKATLEEWKHIFNLRCAKDAHPQIRELMILLSSYFYDTYKI